MGADGSNQRMVECVTPVLAVKSVAQSMAWYRDVLGFEAEWGVGDPVGAVSRDGKPIMLSQRQGGPSEVWIGVEDVLAVHAACVAKGVKIIQMPTQRPWAHEMRVADPDGNVLWFGSEPLGFVK